MPKKKSKDKNEEIDEDVLNELAESLKKTADDGQNDNSELEEDVKVPNNLRFNSFDNFLLDSDSSAPVLERIAGRQAGPVFVGGIPQQSRGTTLSDEKNSDEFKYVPGNNTSGEPKYIDSDSHLTASTSRVDFAKVGRSSDPWSNVNQEAMFVQSAEARAESFAQERMWSTERFDSEKERRKNFAEREEAKYDKYKPDLPKSR